MANIYQLPTPLPATVGIGPVFKFMVSGDSLATVTTAGYLNQVSLEGYPVNNSDVIQTLIDYNLASKSGTFTILIAEVAAGTGIITLAEFSTSTGGITLPTTANHIATYVNTEGELSEDPATAITGGNLQALGNVLAGASGTAGRLTSYAPAANSGTLSVVAANSGANVANVITNGLNTVASTYTLPPILGASNSSAGVAIVSTGSAVTGQLVTFNGTSGNLASAGFNLHGGITPTYAGGGTSNAFTVSGITAASIVTCSIASQTNNASITKVVPSTNTITITFSADPGAGTVLYWSALSAAG